MAVLDLRHGDCLHVLAAMPADSVDAIVTDGPYGLRFMGKRWDYDVPGVDIWSACLRVLKPGGHLLAFAGTRTQHRMAVKIEDAGFEIRDMIAWVYGSGFPKSHDVSKAIDKMDASQEQEMRRLHFTAWVRAQGVKSAQIDEATQTNMGGHYTTAASQPAIMTREHLEACRHLFSDVPAWVERECDIRSVESKNFAAREVVGQYTTDMGGLGGERLGQRGGDITAPATAAAAQWAGWGTALKPAMEPITVARKPLVGTVAENVLQHGTGAINVDGCRVGTDGGTKAVDFGERRGTMYGGGRGKPTNSIEALPAGRWPANLIHDGSDEVVAGFPVTTSKASLRGELVDNRSGHYANASGKRISGSNSIRGHNDTGSAARFFYCAKASKADRDEGCEGMEAKPRGQEYGLNAGGTLPQQTKHKHEPQRNNHPTVKPTELMRYLVRLVTPPGGTVLDPFMGSGSTGKAAVLEGFGFIGIELDVEYIEIARARIAHALQSNKQQTLLL